MALAGQNIAVLGGGIGGLSVALACAQRGADVTVYEQAPAITEVGAGLQISPNGARVLEALGLGQPLKETGLRGQAVSLRDYKVGREVVRLDLNRLEEDQAYLFLHRADLIGVLERACRDAGVAIELGRVVRSVTAGPAPRVQLSDDAPIAADLIIGADGLNSVLRPVLNGEAVPFFTGQVAWRAIVSNSTAHPAEARVHMAPGRHIVSYPLRGGEVVNIVAVEERRDWVEEGWQHAGDPSDLRARFGDFGGETKQLLKGAENVGVWGLFRHPVATNWFGDGVALVGDAAHPTLPFLAQGAVMALEDAWVLAASLDAHADQSTALARYQAARRTRVVRVINTANGNAWKYHLRNPLVRTSAHVALGLAGRLAPSRMLGQFDWLYRFDVTQADI